MGICNFIFDIICMLCIMVNVVMILIIVISLVRDMHKMKSDEIQVDKGEYDEDVKDTRS